MYDSIVSLSYFFVKLAGDEITAVDLPLKGKEINRHVNLENIKSIQGKTDNETIQELTNYANKKFPLIGFGSSRRVYDIDGKKVLKIAYNVAGIAQNFMEARIQNSSDYFAKVYDMHPGSFWIISEKVEKLNPNDFEIITGVPYNVMKQFISQGPDDRLSVAKMTPETANELANKFNIKPNGIKFLNEISKMRGQFDLIFGDTFNPDHWGINQDGKIKIYDFGLDRTVYDNFYHQNGFLRSDPTGGGIIPSQSEIDALKSMNSNTAVY
jgi:hypothetical protein